MSDRYAHLIEIRFINRDSKAEQELMDKFVVENKYLLDAGIRSGAFGETNSVLADSSWNRVKAPTSSFHMWSLVFWKKKSVDDITPSWEKVVCSV